MDGGSGARGRGGRFHEVPARPAMSSTSAYLLGFLVLTIGLAMAAHLAGVPAAWIGAGGIVMVGVGILLSVTKTREREPSPRERR